MTLLVDVYIVRNGRIEYLPEEHPGDTMAGFESFRTELYGSPTALALGLTLLPTLNGSNIHAETKEDLTRLEQEAQILLANIGQVFPGATPDDIGGPGHRLKNIIKAVQRAKEVGGGVSIA